MSWIEVHDTLREHHKTYALAEELRIEQFAAVGLVVSLWTWAINHAQDGDLGKYPPAAIAGACHWRKKPALLTAALVKCGFLTEDLQVHNWELYAGKLLEQREIQKEQSRVRQQKRREKIAGILPGLSGVSHANVTRDITQVSRVNNDVTVPNLTVPNRTKGESTAPGAAAPAAPTPGKAEKQRFGEYRNVQLSEAEFEKLRDEYPRDWQQRIDRLDEYIASKGVKYKNHLATIRAWARKDKQGGGQIKRVAFQDYEQGDGGIQAGPDLLREARQALEG